MSSYLFVMWAGGGNVNPFLGLAEGLLDRGHRVGAVAPGALHGRLAAAGIDIAGTVDGWLATAPDVIAAVDEYEPDLVVVDYMLTEALCGAEASGRPTVALVHTLYHALLADGAPSPMAMAGPVAAINETRTTLGLAPITTLGDLLDATALVLVTAPRELDTSGEVPGNVVYAGALFEGPGPDQDWEPPHGEGPLVVVSIGTAGNPAVETELLGRILAAVATLPARGFVTVPDYVDADRLEVPANVTLSDYVRHAAVLPHADALVTHAGLGSVLVALASGVPMVCIPLDREQPDNARAVARVNAGCTLALNSSPRQIAVAMSEQLNRPDRVRIEPNPERAIELLDALT